MQRIAALSLLLCAHLFLNGCKSATKSADPSANYDATYAESSGTYTVDGSADVYDAGATTGGDAPSGGATHIVKKGDTLYSLARFYYDDESKWKLIFEANQHQLAHRDRVSVGQTLVIP